MIVLCDNMYGAVRRPVLRLEALPLVSGWRRSPSTLVLKRWSTSIRAISSTQKTRHSAAKYSRFHADDLVGQFLNQQLKFPEDCQTVCVMV